MNIAVTYLLPREKVWEEKTKPACKIFEEYYISPKIVTGKKKKKKRPVLLSFYEDGLVLKSRG